MHHRFGPLGEKTRGVEEAEEVELKCKQCKLVTEKVTRWQKETEQAPD